MKKFLLILLSIAVTVGTFWTITSRKQTADLLIVNAVLYTVDAENSVAEAVAIRGSRIVAVGTSQDIQNQYVSQNVIDAKGKTIVPGLIDAHAHVMGLGQSLSELNLVGTTSVEEITNKLAEKVRAAAPGEWIRGRGWDQNDWGSGAGQKPFPTAEMLDKVSPDNPVILSRIDGHAIWVNSKAMNIAAMSSDMNIDVDGGKILRDRFGKPTGIFVDNAETLIRKAVPDYSKEQKKRLYEAALNECLRLGITGVHDMGIDAEDYAIYRELLEQRRLTVRINAQVGGNGALWNEMLRTGPFVDHIGRMLSVRSIKLYMDGALGSRGAALIEPYSDEPGSRGLITTPPDSVRAITEQALRHGFQVCVHAIGDRANRKVLDAFASAAQRFPDEVRSARLRIEHAQVIAPEDIPRFKQWNVIPSMQPTHATSDMYWAQARLGPDRILGAYAWRSLIEEGNIIPSGSDFPVELPNPLLGFYAAVTRQDVNGIPRDATDVIDRFQLSPEGVKDSSYFTGGWYAPQKMTRAEALRSFTMWGAYAEFMEKEKGSIEEGKLADLVMLSQDIMTIEPKRILDTVVEMTIIGGVVKYQRP